MPKGWVVKLKKNIVEEQIRLFVGLAGLFTISAILSSMSGSRVLLILSLALLVLSPFMAYFIVLIKLRIGVKTKA
jgi:hypothetical protein